MEKKELMEEKGFVEKKELMGEKGLMKKKEWKLYNVVFPVWLLVWFPSYLWLLLIPLNYLIDWLVLRFSLRQLGFDRYSQYARKNTWKYCIAGFLSDFVGTVVLLLSDLISSRTQGWWYENIASPVMWNSFSSIWGFLFVCLCIALSGLCIYFLDRWFLKRAGCFTAEQIHKTALRFAILTAPYLFLLPTVWFY